MMCFLLVFLHVLDCTVLCPPTEGEGHIVFAAVPIGINVTLNVCLISQEPLANTNFCPFLDHFTWYLANMNSKQYLGVLSC